MKLITHESPASEPTSRITNINRVYTSNAYPTRKLKG